jgi:hypothetical protein
MSFKKSAVYEEDDVVGTLFVAVCLLLKYKIESNVAYYSAIHK